MNLKKISTSAYALELAIEKHKDLSSEVELFGNGINDLVEKAKIGKIQSAIDRQDIPGKYFFQDGELSKFSALEEAYADFVLLLTDENDEDILEFIDNIDTE